MNGVIRNIALGLLAGVSFAMAVPADLSRARELYQRTEYEAALEVLRSLPQKDAPAYSLMGQCYFMEGELKKATDSFQQAASLDQNESNYQLWLGRAYGRRAETSSFITAPGLASRAHTAFEAAVRLNPRNQEALSDLFEYYLDAPGFLGGGFDKASALAKRMGELNAAEGAWAQSRLAEKRKEFGTAEQQLRRAMDLAPRQVGRVIDLAKFLAKSGRYQESDETFRHAEAIAPDSPKLLFERASTYIETHRNIDLAKALLKRYMEASLTADDPPRKKAEELLKQVSSS